MNNDQQNNSQLTPEEQELASVLDDINNQVDSVAAATPVADPVNQTNPTSDATSGDAASQELEDQLAEAEQQFDQLNDQLAGDTNLSPDSNQETQPTPEAPAEETAPVPGAEEFAPVIPSENEAETEVAPSITMDPPAVPAVEEMSFDAPAVAPNESAVVSESSNDGDSELSKIKNMALKDLKPLVNKLNLSKEEKFEILLLLIRSTDDRQLLNSAYEAAREIEDEEKRAKALLDVIKETDYFSSKK